MKKIIEKNFLIFIILIYFAISITSPSCYAANHHLVEYLYKAGGRSSWYFFKRAATDSGPTYDRINEEITETKEGKTHFCAIKKQGTFDNLYFRYNWLHAAYDMNNYVAKKSYQDLADENDDYEYPDYEYLQDAVIALDYTIHALGSFSLDTEDLPDVGHDFLPWKNDDVWAEFGRSKEAYKDIVGHYYSKPNGDELTDEFEISLADSIKKLHAAYDYKNRTTEYCANANIWDDFDKKSKYSEAQIRSYLNSYGERFNVDNSKRDELIKKWEDKIDITLGDAISEYDGKASTGEVDVDEAESHAEKRVDNDTNTVFAEPKNNTAIADNGAEDVINDAENFVNDKENVTDFVSTDELKNFSQNLYGILFGIGVIVAVIVGLIIGIKLMLAPVEERAEAKKLLIPYVVGCVVVFGAFGLWQLAVTILQQI